MKIIILFFSTILIVNIAKSQNINPLDTIEYARSKAYEKDFIEADKLLTEYNRFHKDVNALRLHAQVLYWMKNFDRSIEVYERTISKFPNIAVVKLDYGRMSFELGKQKKAQALLNDFITTDSFNVEANIMLSYYKYMGRAL
jgi:predicted Zn-dependent protease